MALSMEEERILAEIEQELERSEPVLAACLTMFSAPRPGTGQPPRAQPAGAVAAGAGGGVGGRPDPCSPCCPL